MENKDINPDQDPDMEEDEMEGEQKDKQKGNQKLISAIKAGDYDTCKKLIDKKANIFQEDLKKKWTPLVWATVKNQINIVKLLLSKGAASIYMSNPPQLPQIPADQSSQFVNPQKCTMGIINYGIKQTPLQWATFKGNIQVIWLLLKEGMSWQDVDAFGNNCVHLSASNGTLQIFQIYMMIGVDVYCKNSRGHEAVDLATNQQIIELIKLHKATQKCTNCHKELDNLKKHWCCTCGQFFCPACYKLEWVWETPESTEKERIDGKCLKCWDIIARHTAELQEKMKLYDHAQLTQKILEIEGKQAKSGNEDAQSINSSVVAQKPIEIDLKLKKDALILQEKLRTQNIILDKINSLKVVENYKTILKSVNQLKEMKEDAKARNVEIDPDVIEKLDGCMDRLVAERNLRFQLDNIDVGNCFPEDVKVLQDLMDQAKQKGVAANYMEVAEQLNSKMSRSIQTKDIYKLFTDYPVRAEYTTPVVQDFKTKKPIDPITKKPVDIKALLAPKKKKKKGKEPKFVIPEWANDLPSMDKQIKSIEQLLKESEELELHKDFIKEANDQITRMKTELKYRKALEEEQRIINELRAAMKKNKK